MSMYWCEHAWLPDGPAAAVAITVDDGEITRVARNAPRAGTVLRGLVVPGFANGHSHAFHRALRGRTHGESGTFWTWRDRMYALAERLDPDSYYRLARAVYAEMVLAGFTTVGEFHYVHHAPGGVRYSDANAMAAALVAAALDAGIRLTLLDTCYLSAGFAGEELNPAQRRFSDGDADGWAARADALADASASAPGVRVGAAAHSVRAVPAGQLPIVAQWAKARSAPLHAHVSEQRAENDACIAACHQSPVEVFGSAAALDERFVAVHATHLSTKGVGMLGSAGSGACFCPTTERDLGDGIGPARDLVDAGVTLSIGSDSHAVIDPWEELRALEMNQRLAKESRGQFSPGDLVAAATRHGALGWPDVGLLAEGAAADLVTVSLDSVRLAGCEPGQIPLCANGFDVRDVMVAGRWVVRDGLHTAVERPAAELARSVAELMS